MTSREERGMHPRKRLGAAVPNDDAGQVGDETGVTVWFLPDWSAAFFDV
jgi:hypothetical protein